MKIVIESTIEKISSRVDGTVAIGIGTNELDASKAGELFGLRGKYVKVLISDSNITNLEAETVDAAQLVGVKKNKTPSARLRACYYRLWEQVSPEIEFDTFYASEMEKIITHIKNKLN